MHNQHVILLGYLNAQSGKEDLLFEVLQSLIKPSREEDGCIEYTLHRSTTNNEQFMYYEIWRDQASLIAHTQSPHIVAWRNKKDDLLREQNESSFWSRIY